jgi:collagen type III alpha
MYANPAAPAYAPPPAGPALAAGAAAGAAVSTLTPWETKPAAAAPSGPVLAPVRTKSIPRDGSADPMARQPSAKNPNLAATAGVGAAAAVGAGAAAAAYGSRSERDVAPAAQQPPASLTSQGSGAWKTNVRPASAASAPVTDAAAAAALASSSGGGAPAPGSTMTGRPVTQQAERAKFWAQFQETWQQVSRVCGVAGLRAGLR